MARNLSVAQARKAPAPAPDLRESVQKAVAGMGWLTPTDQALVDLALNYAAQIEEAVNRRELIDELWAEVRGDRSLTQKLQKLEAMCDEAKMIGWLGPQLQGVLRDLGGTPTARKAMAPDGPMGGRLAALRAGAAKPARVDDTPTVD